VVKYGYNSLSNQVSAVTDPTAGIRGRGDFYDGSSTYVEYEYDAAGNMTKDYNKDIKIDYNLINLPMMVTCGITSTYGTLKYSYTATGAKLRMQSINTGGTTNTDYIGEFVYKNNILSYIITPEGRAVPKAGGGFDYEYDLRDHLGNTRVTCKAATYDANNNVTSITVVQKNSYYPFGILHGGKLTIATNRYLYNGKELHADYNFDLYDYGFRFYDAQLGRFVGIDPIAEKYAFVTPYNYAENSPIANIDLWGLQSYYAADGRLLDVVDPSNPQAYVETSPGAFRVLNISNNELNERSFWVYNECRGSNEIITNDEIVTNAGNQVDLGKKGIEVAEIYANAVNNAVKTDGGWTELLDGKRISRTGPDGNTIYTGKEMMKGNAGQQYTKDLVNDYLPNKNDPSVFKNHGGSENARAAVASSIINPNSLGGVRAWFGSTKDTKGEKVGDAERYFNNPKTSTAQAKVQFSFSTKDGTFFHSLYRK